MLRTFELELSDWCSQQSSSFGNSPFLNNYCRKRYTDAIIACKLVTSISCHGLRCSTQLLLSDQLRNAHSLILHHANLCMSVHDAENASDQYGHINKVIQVGDQILSRKRFLRRVALRFYHHKRFILFRIWLMEQLWQIIHGWYGRRWYTRKTEIRNPDGF